MDWKSKANIGLPLEVKRLELLSSTPCGIAFSALVLPITRKCGYHRRLVPLPRPWHLKETASEGLRIVCCSSDIIYYTLDEYCYQSPQPIKYHILSRSQKHIVSLIFAANRQAPFTLPEYTVLSLTAPRNQPSCILSTLSIQMKSLARRTSFVHTLCDKSPTSAW